MVVLQPKFAKKQKYMPQNSKLKCIRDIYPVQIDMIYLPTISSSRQFPGKICIITYYSKHIFHMIGNKSFHFNSWEVGGGGGDVTKNGLYPLIYIFSGGGRG